MNGVKLTPLPREIEDYTESIPSLGKELLQ